MNGVTKTLLRSILRWTRYPHVKYAPFRIDLSKVIRIDLSEVINIDKSLQELRQTLPPDLQVITDASGVRAATLHSFRRIASENAPAQDESAAQDTMFAVIKYLNSRSLELKSACNSREYRSSEKVQQSAGIRVGQVVQHRVLGYRAVCIGWTTDSDSQRGVRERQPVEGLVERASDAPGGGQRLKLLLDWYDFEDLQGEFHVFPASDFHVLPPGPQARVSHQQLGRYFCRYDSSLGVYIPNKTLHFKYPLDMSQVLASSGLFSRYRQADTDTLTLAPTTSSSDSDSDSGEHTTHATQATQPSSSFTTSATRAKKKYTTFSPDHLDALEIHLKQNHHWVGNEVYTAHEEKIGQAASDFLRMTRELCGEMNGLMKPLGLDLTKPMSIPADKKEASTHQSILGSETVPLLWMLHAGTSEASSQSSEPAFAPASYHAQRLAQDLTNRRQELKRWNDNSTLPLSETQTEKQAALLAVKIVTALYAEVERSLVLRFQNLRGRVSEFESRVPGAVSDDERVERTEELEANEEERGGVESLLSDLSEPVVKFRVGQVLRHKQNGTRGVCAGWDVRPVMDTSQWKWVAGLPLGVNQPFYRIIPDNYDVKDFHYVAQENLEIVSMDTTSTDSNETAKETDIQTYLNRQKLKVHNKNVDRFFSEFNLKTGAYAAKDELQFCFSLLPETPESRIEATTDATKTQLFKECETVLLEMYSLLNKFFSSFRSPSAENNLLLLLKHASSREEAADLEAVHWLAAMSASPSSACSSHMREGMAALCRGDHDGALQLFVAASQKDPTFGEAYNKAGGIHALRNDHLACVTFSALTLQRNPRHFAALAGQGLALAAIAEDGDKKDALAAMRSSLELNPWASQVSSRFTALLHETQAASGEKGFGGGLPRKKGSLRVVHLTSEESLEPSNSQNEEQKQEEAGEDDNSEERDENADDDAAGGKRE